MVTVSLILLVLAFCLFTIAAVWNPPPPAPWFGRLVAAGLACWSLSVLLGGIGGIHLH